jgi:hypothetical protein
MSCGQCDQYCHQGRNCRTSRVAIPLPGPRKPRSSAFLGAINDLMHAIAAVVVTCILGFGLGVLFWVVTKAPS